MHAHTREHASPRGTMYKVSCHAVPLSAMYNGSVLYSGSAAGSAQCCACAGRCGVVAGPRSLHSLLCLSTLTVASPLRLRHCGFATCIPTVRDRYYVGGCRTGARVVVAAAVRSGWVGLVRTGLCIAYCPVVPAVWTLGAGCVAHWASGTCGTKCGRSSSHPPPNFASSLAKFYMLEELDGHTWCVISVKKNRQS